MIFQLQRLVHKVGNRLGTIRKREKKDKTDGVKVAAMPLPKVGDDIYVPTHLYLSHGCDDVVGGLAKVKSVSGGISGGEQVHFISVVEIFGDFNWEHYLALMQDELKKEFDNNRAYPKPDDRSEFNEFYS